MAFNWFVTVLRSVTCHVCSEGTVNGVMENSKDNLQQNE
jgi:hypothetical protein